jgi:hypothetical protein
MLEKTLLSWIRAAIMVLTGLLTRLGTGNPVVLIHTITNRGNHQGGPSGWGFAFLCVVVLLTRLGPRTNQPLAIRRKI